ncbi:hypothetical protein PCA20602_01825 [Pandoraea capi]|uniref:Uncharacterized protein n=1 Tax=Pandoraea capi TaxID=2508286 RepID=A0ABY6VWL1_9BURK|nr:hypothetical protein [Pandoraea capi]VVD94758.1 hypothetical protein PCA20602_01825 [Pandoraea capi]
MPYVSHHRAIVAPPSYTRSHASDPRRNARSTHSAHEFPRRFRGSRITQRANPLNTLTASNARTAPRRPRNTSQRDGVSPWPAVLALAVVANLAARTSAMPEIPAGGLRQRQPPDVGTPGSVEDDVRILPIRSAAIKTDYPFPDLLRAVGAASAPFRHLGQSIDDLRFAVSGESIGGDTLATMQRIGDFVDQITGLVPSVQRLRLPAYVADLAADAAQGEMPIAERIASLIQMSDPRSLGAAIPMNADGEFRDVAPGNPALSSAAVQSREVAEPTAVRADVVAQSETDVLDASRHSVDAIRSDAITDVGPDVPDISADAPPAPLAAALPDGVPVAASDEAVANEIPDVQQDGQILASATSARRSHIDAEHEYLTGYAQQLSPESLPPEPHAQLILVDGRHYLRGEAGYYRVTRAPGTSNASGDEHWLVDAPRGTRAQIPVTFDAHTGTWRAERALRLCGGGCGPSRESTPDSVGTSMNQVADAIRHIKRPQVREAILKAYDDLSRMHLMRTNREDLRAMRDNSIVEHRRVLVPQLMRLDPHATLFEQQREAATITTIHYDNYAETGFYTLSPEAFCQENAEILFHYLLTRGVPSPHIRMITVRPQGHPPHVMVLYTESDQFIDLLELNTPQPPVAGHVDGINGEKFTAAVFLTRDSTVLLDPWSRVKASSFRHADDIEEMMGMLDVSLADAGHRAGNPFVVSVTRPYPAPRDRIHLVKQSIADLRDAAKRMQTSDAEDVAAKHDGAHGPGEDVPSSSDDGFEPSV